MAWLVRTWLAAMVVAAAVLGYGLVTSSAPTAHKGVLVTPGTLSSSTHVVMRAQVWRYSTTHKSAPVST